MIAELFQNFSGLELIHHYFKFYEKQKGEISMQEAVKKVHTSNRIISYISRAAEHNLSPGLYGIVEAVNSTTYFLFSKAETLCFGALTAVYIWEKKAREAGHPITGKQFHEVVVATIVNASKGKIDLEGTGFFYLFFSHLETLQQKPLPELEGTNIIAEQWEIDFIKKKRKFGFYLLSKLETMNNNYPDLFHFLSWEDGAAEFGLVDGQTKVFSVEPPFPVGSILGIKNQRSEQVAAENGHHLKLKTTRLNVQKVKEVSTGQIETLGYRAKAEQNMGENEWIEDDALKQYFLRCFERKHGKKRVIGNSWIWIYEFEVANDSSIAKTIDFSTLDLSNLVW